MVSTDITDAYGALATVEISANEFRALAVITDQQEQSLSLSLPLSLSQITGHTTTQIQH